MIKKAQPDILITDIRMPFMDGLELSELVKKEFPKIKLIILSGYNEFDYAKQAIHIGVTDYLLKPITASKLLEAVKKVADVIEKRAGRGRHAGALPPGDGGEHGAGAPAPVQGPGDQPD